MNTTSSFTAVDDVKDRVVISSKVDELSVIEDYLETLNDRYCFKEDVYGNILVSVTEAVNNAIFHGNSSDPAKRVTVACRLLNPYLLAIEVTDEGPGFDPAEIKDPTQEENLLAENGRGIFVMKHLSDQLLFHGTGNTVEMRYNI